jgi:hypothetical protein
MSPIGDSRSRNKRVIGWREWVSLPELAIPAMKAKIDTGARSSALHAWDIETFERDGQTYVRFLVHPMQRSTSETIRIETPVVDERSVRSSSGHDQLRIIIRPQIEIFGQRYLIDLSLTNRDVMGFRMLLGREALRGRFFVDPGRSYLAGRPFEDS